MYLHFLINLGVGSFFLWTITHTIGVDAISLCPVSAEEGTAQDPCHKLLNSGKGILIGGIVLIWLVELCESPANIKFPYITHSPTQRWLTDNHSLCASSSCTEANLTRVIPATKHRCRLYDELACSI